MTRDAAEQREKRLRYDMEQLRSQQEQTLRIFDTWIDTGDTQLVHNEQIR